MSIIVTWPKTKPLTDYLAELERAAADELLINFRVARPPSWPDAFEDHGAIGWPYGAEPRCYRVHDGFIRGFTPIVTCAHRQRYQVRTTASDPKQGNEYWPAGWYIICKPHFSALAEPIPMRGFQGWRWFEREQTNA